MSCDPAVQKTRQTVHLLHFIKSKGKEGAKLREIWINLVNGEYRLSPACVINQLDRLKREVEVIEVREHKSQGYLRRFYDLNHAPDNSG